MQPFKLRFEYEQNITDDDKSFSGIERINAAIRLADERFMVHNSFPEALKTTIPMADAEIIKCFKNDLAKQITFDIVDIQYDITNLKPGRQPYGNGASFQYDLKLKAISDTYTCLHIKDDGTYVCFGKDDILRNFRISANTIARKQPDELKTK